MEIGLITNGIRHVNEGEAAFVDDALEVLERLEVTVDDRFVHQRPQAFGRLELGAVGGEMNQAQALGHFQPG